MTPPDWTHPSVLAFAEDADPVEVMTERARAVVADAIDRGWEGPPFNPLQLADLLGLRVVARDDVQDARTVPLSDASLQIEYNPTRPRGRMRYSLAHEIAHTLFADCSEEVRHRGYHAASSPDAWQLEALCNIAAAEFLMPFGTVAGLIDESVGLEQLLDAQRRFDVSTEALVLRVVRLRPDPCAMFCASPLEEAHGSPYHVDYLVGSVAWENGISSGAMIPRTSAVNACTGIGFTASAEEQWGRRRQVVECVGIPAYPGSRQPRVVGLLRPPETGPADPLLHYVRGDATKPRGDGLKILTHIVTDAAIIWGGSGFAAAVRRAWPEAQDSFREWSGDERKLPLGSVHLAAVREDLTVASMVAQHGYGPSRRPRLRYAALRKALDEVGKLAREARASVHMPRIGCGEAGGWWDAVEEMVRTYLTSRGVPVTVYDLPGNVAPGASQLGLRLESV
jgi:O-acetyl-ADP-ribose deacetylase (regulator of RNase III)